MAEEKLGASFSIDISDLRAGLQQASRLIKENRSEFAAASAGLEDWSKSETAVNAKIEELKKNLKVQNTVLEAYEKQLLDAGYAEDDMSKAAVELRTKINNQKATIENTKKALSDTEKTLDDLKDSSDDAGDAIEDSGKKAEKASGGFTVVKGALANLVAEGFRKAIDAAKEFATSMITTAAEVKAENSQYEQAFGDLVSVADQAVTRVANSTGILRDRLTGTAASIYSFARSSGATTSEAMELMEASLMATADSAAYYDKSLEDTAETLQSFLKGNFANDAALGVSATEFTRNAKAAELFGKKYNDLSEIEKQKTLLKMVTDSQKLSGAMGQATRESDGFENVMGNVNETWRQFKAKVGTPVLEALIPVIQEATTKFQKFANSVDWKAFGKKVSTVLKEFIDKGKSIAKNVLPTIGSALKIVGKVVGFVIDNFELLATVVGTAVVAFKAFKAVMAVTTAISAAKTAVAGLTTGVGLATKAQTIWNATMAANPIGAVVTAVALLAGGVALLSVALGNNKTETEKAIEAEKEHVQALKEENDAYIEAKDAAWEKANAELGVIENAENYFTALQNLVDANGKVKEADQDRVRFILNELNNALGTEYKLVDGIVQGYKSMPEAIKASLDAEKARILLQPLQEDYTSALQKTNDTESESVKIKREIAEQEKKVAAAAKETKAAWDEYNKQVEAGFIYSAYTAYLENEALRLEKNLDTEKALLTEKENAYKSNEDLLAGYYADIANYETAQTLLLSGETEKAISYISSIGQSYSDLSNTAQTEAEKQYQIALQNAENAKIAAELQKQRYAEGVKGVTEEMVQAAIKASKDADAQLETAGENLTNSIGKGTKTAIPMFTPILETLFGKPATVSLTFAEAYKKLGGNIVSGIAEGANDKSSYLNSRISGLITSSLKSAEFTAQIKSPSRLFKKRIGVNIGLGVAAGVDDSTKDVVRSVKQQIKSIESSYDVAALKHNVSAGLDVSGTLKTAKPESQSVNVYQTNNYSQSHSQYELYKSKQQTAAAVRLAMGV